MSRNRGSIPVLLVLLLAEEFLGGLAAAQTIGRVEMSLPSAQGNFGAAKLTPVPGLASPWKDVGTRLQQATGEALPLQAEDLRRETAELLRNDPSLPLDAAIASAYGKVYGLPPEKVLAARNELLGGTQFKAKADLIMKSDFLHAFDGKIYFDPKYVFDGQRIKELPPEEIIDSLRLDVKRWIGVNKLSVGPINYQAVVAGERYLSTAQGLYRREFGYWKEVATRNQIGTVNHLTLIGKTLYAATSKGVFVKRWDGWKPTEIKKPSFYIGQSDGQLVAGIETGLFAKAVGEDWREIRGVPSGESFHDIQEIGGRLYGLTSSTFNNLYRLDNNTWASLKTGFDWVDRIAGLAGKLHFVRGNLLYAWAEAHSLAELSEDIGKAIEEAGKTPGNRSHEAPPPPHALENDGNVRDGRGRVIFSGLHTGVEPEKAPEPPPASPFKKWAELERLIGDALTAAPPSRPEELRRETAEALRNEPALSIEAAVARAYGKLHGLDPAQIAAAEKALAPGRHIVFKRHHPWNLASFFRDKLHTLAGKLILGTGMVFGGENWNIWPPDEEISGYRSDGTLLVQGWIRAKRIFAGDIHNEITFNGREYLATDWGLYRKGKNSWKSLTPFFFLTKFRRVSLVDGELYLAADNGIYVRRWYGWKRLTKTPVFYVGQRDGEIVGVTEKGLSRFTGGKAQAVVPLPESSRVKKVLEHNGEIYAVTSEGVLRLDKDRWSNVPMGDTGETNFDDAASFDGRLYFSSKGPKFQEVWTFMASGHLRPVLQDVGAAVEQSRKADESKNKADPDDSLKVDAGAVVRSDGRTIFSP